MEDMRTESLKEAALRMLTAGNMDLCSGKRSADRQVKYTRRYLFFSPGLIKKGGRSQNEEDSHFIK